MRTLLRVTGALSGVESSVVLGLGSSPDSTRTTQNEQPQAAKKQNPLPRMSRTNTVISGYCVQCIQPPTVTYNKHLGVINIGGCTTLSVDNAWKVSDQIADLLDEIDKETE